MCSPFCGLASPASTRAYGPEPDLAFGLNGVAQPGFETQPYLNASARDVAIQPDGKLVFAGWASRQFPPATPPCSDPFGCGAFEWVVGRLTAGGQLDPSFSGDGRVFLGLYSSEAWDVAVQPDGKIVVAGYVSEDTSDLDVRGSDLLVARYLPSGEPDLSFSGDGMQTTDIGVNDEARELEIQPDGKIVAAGSTWEVSCPTPVDCAVLSDFLVVRYLSNGQPDLTFSGDGVQTTAIDETDWGVALAVQPDGKMVVAGTAYQSGLGSVNDRHVVARYLPGGDPDPSFSGDGIQTSPAQPANSPPGGTGGLAVQADGKLLLAGQYGDSFALRRYLPDGQPDSGFSDDGLALVAFDSRSASSVDVVLQPDDKPVAVGGVSGGTIALARFLPSGAVDFVHTFGYGNNGVEAVALQPDGKIVLAGGGVALSIFRFQEGASPPPDRDFDGIPDPNDRCPDVYTPLHLDPDRDGCPGTSVIAAGPPQCIDGVDNDGDGRTDFPADTECVSPMQNDERGQAGKVGGGAGAGAGISGEEESTVRPFGALRRVKWGVSWMLRCPAARGSCTGQARLLAAGSRVPPSAAPVYGKTKRKIAAGQARRVTVRLGREARRLLARKRRLRLSVEAKVRYPGGRHVRSRSVILKAPPAR